MSSKVMSLKGMQDFYGIEVFKRQKIIQTLTNIVRSYGYLPLETASMEHLKTLTGNYGSEENKLLYKVLNSGIDIAEIQDIQSINQLSDKGLRYDLTVPMLRYVASNLNKITFPWRRYQVQNVWRADRPQKGRYREFLQFDLDLIGCDNELYEAEILSIGYKALVELGIKNFKIEINHIELFKSFLESIGELDNFRTIFSIIDKTDKIGIDLVINELQLLGFSDNLLDLIKDLNCFILDDCDISLKHLKKKIGDSNLRAFDQFCKTITLLKTFGVSNEFMTINPLLARGLSYYSGIIFEIKIVNDKSTTILAGGRYDGMLYKLFDLKNLYHNDSAIGLSFGIDRIYNLLIEYNGFDDSLNVNHELLICLSPKSIEYAIVVGEVLRERGIIIEFYNANNLKKALDYANKKKLVRVNIIGEDEQKAQVVTKKNMLTGKEEQIALLQ